MVRISFQDLPKNMFEKLIDMEQFINQSGVSYKLLELIRLRVSQLNGCAYCIDMHNKELKHLEETDLRLSSLSVWRETPYFDEQEKAVLEFTEKLTFVSKNIISDEVYENLSSFFSKSQVCFLTLAISQICLLYTSPSPRD